MNVRVDASNASQTADFGKKLDNVPLNGKSGVLIGALATKSNRESRSVEITPLSLNGQSRPCRAWRVTISGSGVLRSMRLRNDRSENLSQFELEFSHELGIQWGPGDEVGFDRIQSQVHAVSVAHDAPNREALVLPHELDAMIAFGWQGSLLLSCQFAQALRQPFEVFVLLSIQQYAPCLCSY